MIMKIFRCPLLNSWLCVYDGVQEEVSLQSDNEDLEVPTPATRNDLSIDSDIPRLLNAGVDSLEAGSLGLARGVAPLSVAPLSVAPLRVALLDTLPDVGSFDTALLVSFLSLH